MKTMLVYTSIRKLCQTFILTNRIHEITILLDFENIQLTVWPWDCQISPRRERWITAMVTRNHT